MNILDVVIQP